MRTETLFQWLIRKITDEKLQYVSTEALPKPTNGISKCEIGKKK
nr:MAG TPA: hypothetical protein [Caudoviricetes sp.]